MKAAARLARFTRGLVSDRVPVPGGLLEANNMIPVNGGQAWKLREGLTRTINSSATVAHAAFPCFGLWASDVRIIGYYNIGTTSNFFGLGTGTTHTMPPTVLNHAGAALSMFGGLGSNVMRPSKVSGRYVTFNRELFSPGDSALASGFLGIKFAGRERFVGGAVGTLPTVTGTAAGTLNQRTVTLTGASTVGTVTAYVGCYIWINDATVGERPYRIVKASSNTSLTVDRPFPASFTGVGFRIDNMSWWSCKPGTFGFPSAAVPVSPVNTKSSPLINTIAVHQGRIFGGGTVEWTDNTAYPDRLRWCAPANETDGTHWGGAEYWHASAYVDVMPGVGTGIGTRDGIMGLASWGGRLYIFKHRGVFVLQGNVETDGRDVGANINVITLEDGVYTPGALCETPMGIVFAGRNGVYMIDDRGLRNISQEAGVRNIYEAMFADTTSVGSGGTAGTITGISFSRGRLFVQGSNTGTLSIIAPNYLVCDMKQGGLWYTMTTDAMTKFADVEGFGTVGHYTSWGYWGHIDRSVSQAAQNFDEMGVNGRVVGRLTTHPISLSSPGSPNGRVRAVQALVRTSEDGIRTPSIAATVLVGEADRETAIEAPLSFATAIQDTSELTERWMRSILKVGCQPVDSARVRLTITNTHDVVAVDDARVYEIALEAVPVGRLR